MKYPSDDVLYTDEEKKALLAKLSALIDEGEEFLITSNVGGSVVHIMGLSRAVFKANAAYAIADALLAQAPDGELFDEMMLALVTLKQDRHRAKQIQ